MQTMQLYAMNDGADGSSGGNYIYHPTPFVSPAGNKVDARVADGAVS